MEMQSSTSAWWKLPNAPASNRIFTEILATGTDAISRKRLKTKQQLRVVTSHQSPDPPSTSSSSSSSPSPAPPFSSISSSSSQAMEFLKPQGSAKLAGSVVALGKFDALHIGHRSLAEQASRMGPPVLLSFTGMGEILGWEKRLPIVAPCDRARVMLLWSDQCSGLTPDEFSLEFGKVRHLSPDQFVEKLAMELRVKGVVAGENYRFGYRAAGDSSKLKNLCREWGIEAVVVEPVMDKFEQAPSSVTGDARDRGQVSSTRVRKALAEGNMKRVTELLGRNHRLVMTLGNAKIENFNQTSEGETRVDQNQPARIPQEQNRNRLLYRLPLANSCNQFPAEGTYPRCKISFQGQQQSSNGNGGALGRFSECDVDITQDEARIWDLEDLDHLQLQLQQGLFLSIEFSAAKQELV